MNALALLAAAVFLAAMGLSARRRADAGATRTTALLWFVAAALALVAAIVRLAG